ncbi:unnamed protein product [Brassicogethes aeneus]|uniref:UTP--glucose-1-phosphate uridylyltransferase n=1 Tax=Brassicogethes aeneus TaxID=1431903 RepID=A0A9P0FCD8_BRAAE|nr:unnamed protein product [Brassicogethes aeneus]
MDSMEQALNKIASASKDEQLKTDLDGFKDLFKRYLDKTEAPLLWENIQKLPEDAILDSSTFETIEDKSVIKEFLGKLVVIKLNGGLGTTMGCTGPKSVIPVRNGLTFLDLTLQQIEHLNEEYGVSVPLVLMNSFNTHDDTTKVLEKYITSTAHLYIFNQSCHPRINAESLLPVPTTGDVQSNLEAWTPPGHGDFYVSFKNSGLLEKFISEQKEYCFVSNIDNLGATVDINIANYLMNPCKSTPTHEFIMEFTDKTRADVKGGTLIKYEDKLRILEIAQVPKDHVEDFKSVKLFKYFNTNNLWLKLDALKRVMDADALRLEIIPNGKSLKDGTKVVQLETIIGAGMKFFENAVGIKVPRSRFLPVKKCSDLLLVMSNLYELQHGSLMVSPERMFPGLPAIKLGDEHFSKVKDFLARFSSIPDILELDHLTVIGDVTFGKEASLRGTVIIIANKGNVIEIPRGAILENKIITGNLAMIDY